MSPSQDWCPHSSSPRVPTRTTTAPPQRSGGLERHNSCAPLEVDAADGEGGVAETAEAGAAAPKTPKREPQQVVEESPHKTSKKGRPHERSNLELLTSMQAWQDRSERRLKDLVQRVDEWEQRICIIEDVVGTGLHAMESRIEEASKPTAGKFQVRLETNQ